MVTTGDSMPRGTVALVFTDIQGSTEAWERLGNDYAGVLRTHNDVMRAAIERCAGHEVKTEGDAFMVAFGRASDAVRFAIEAQRGLESVTLPDTGEAVSVRMGVHVGEPICEADPVTGRMDYFGPMVNRAARVSSAAHGGQTLVTGAVHDSAPEAFEGARVRDMGEHRLKGLERFERLYEVLPADWADRVFPPLRTLTALPTNLPAQATSFIGRRKEWNEIAEALTEDDVRLVTLSGPGGIGKTRLTIRVGDEVLERFKGGVWFVELEDDTTPVGVAERVASALGIPTSGKGPVEAVASALEIREPTLLILDNFEQVVEAAPETVGLWLKRAARTKVLVSSRVLLGVEGEREYPLSALPDPREGNGSYAEYDAVRLFVDRAKAANARFELTAENGADVASICAELDGIPLAIELAAARSKVMKPAQILDRLTQRFKLLRSSRRDLPGRQQTLEGAIAWSYDLLEEWERSAFVQSCVFRGGFTLESAEAVIDLWEHDDAPLGMDAVQTLREKSLLHWSDGGRASDEGRFGMYVSVRDFGRLKAEEVLDEEMRNALLERYVEHWLGFVAEWEGVRRGDDFRGAMDRIEPEIENLLHAQSCAIQIGRPEDAARIALDACTTMALRGPSGRRTGALSAVLEALGDRASGGLGCELLCAMSMAEMDAGELVPAGEHAERAMEVAEASGDDLSIGNALLRRGECARLIGELDRAREDFARAVSCFERADEQAGGARAASGLGSTAWQAGDFPEAILRFEEAHGVFDAIGNKAGAARSLGGLGIVLSEGGDHARAVGVLEEAEEICRELADRPGLARTLMNKGIRLRELERFDEAIYCFSEAELLNRQMGRRASLSRTIGSRALVLERRGEFDAALECYEQGEEVQRATGDVPGIALFRTRRARTLHAMARDEEALECLAEALGLLREGGVGEGRIACETLGWLAFVEDALGHESAKKHALEGERVRTKLGVSEAVYGSPDVSARVAALIGEA